MSKLVNQCWALCPGFRQVIPKFWINSECVSRNSGPQFMSWNQRGRITRQLPKPKNEVWGETWQKPRPKTRACHTGWWRLGDKTKEPREKYWPQGEAGGSKIRFAGHGEEQERNDTSEDEYRRDGRNLGPNLPCLAFRFISFPILIGQAFSFRCLNFDFF